MDVYPYDYVYREDGKKYSVPRYYDKYLKKYDQIMLIEVKERRKQNALKNQLTPDRLKQMLEHKIYSQKQLIRELENAY